MLIKRGYKMKTEVLKLRFKGSNDIDLTTLSDSLSYIVDTLSKIADNTLNENDFCKFKVKAISKGSFVIDVEQIIETAVVLFPYMPSIIESFNNIVELRKVLGGQFPEKVIHNGDSVEIHAKDNSQITINNYIYDTYKNNPAIENNLSNLSKIISEDRERTGLCIESDAKTVDMNYDDLLRTSKAIDVESLNEDIEENLMTTTLKVKQPDLVGNSKWEFMHNGKSISVNIEDMDFIESVRAGKVDFHAGMKIRAEVLVRYRNESVISYRLIKVIDIEK